MQRIFSLQECIEYVGEDIKIKYIDHTVTMEYNFFRQSECSSFLRII